MREMVSIATRRYRVLITRHKHKRIRGKTPTVLTPVAPLRPERFNIRTLGMLYYNLGRLMRVHPSLSREVPRMHDVMTIRKPKKRLVTHDHLERIAADLRW